MRLNITALALASGLLWGVGLFLITWWIIAVEGTSDQVTFIGKAFQGYTVTAAGSLIGLVWAFFAGLICGAVFAWLYNLIAGQTSKTKEM